MTLVNMADLSVQNINIKDRKFLRVEKFLCNSTWRLPQVMQSDSKKKTNDVVTKIKQSEKNFLEFFFDIAQSSFKGSTNHLNGIYFYGEPGIGKSTAFATLIYIMYLQNSEAKSHFLKLFPYFQGSKNFIFIEAQQLQDQYVLKLQTLARRLVNRKYVVVIDDIHLLKNDAKVEKHFLKILKQNCKKLIFLSSQGPANEPFKNSYHDIVLVEVPQTEAVLQISDILEENISQERFIPPQMRDFIAYRLWFYLGGNFRKIKQILSPTHQYWYTYYEMASAKANDISVLLNKTKAKQFPDDQKKMEEMQEQFKNGLTFLLGKGHDLDSVMDLKFGTLKFRPILQESKKDKKLSSLIENNVLVYRRLNPKSLDQKATISMNKAKYNPGNDPSNGKEPIDRTKLVIGFHSRRVQYAFGQYFLHDYQEYWKDKKEKRARFQQYLERIEFKHIIDFEHYRLHKRAMEEEILQLKYKKEKLGLQIQDQNKLDQYLAIYQKLKPVMELVEAQNELTIAYFEAYQLATYPKKYQNKENFYLNIDFEKLRSGPNFFYSACSGQIERGLKGRDDLQQKVKECRERIEVCEKSLEVLKLRKQYLEEDYKGFKNDLDMHIQNLLNSCKSEDSLDPKLREQARQILETPGATLYGLYDFLKAYISIEQQRKFYEVLSLTGGIYIQLDECTRKIEEREKLTQQLEGGNNIQAKGQSNEEEKDPKL